MARPRKLNDAQPTAEDVYGVIKDLLNVGVLVLTEELRGRTTAGPFDRDAFWKVREALNYAKKVIPVPDKAVVPQIENAKVIGALRLDFDSICQNAATQPASPERDSTLIEALFEACSREAKELGIKREHVKRAVEGWRTRNQISLAKEGKPDTDWLKGCASDERGSALYTSGVLLASVLSEAGCEQPAQGTSWELLQDLWKADLAEMTRIVGAAERIGLLLGSLGVPREEIPWVGERLRHLLRHYLADGWLPTSAARSNASVESERTLPVPIDERASILAVLTQRLIAELGADPVTAESEASRLLRAYLSAPTDYAGREVPSGARWAPPSDPWKAAPGVGSPDEREHGSVTAGTVISEIGTSAVE